MREHLAQEIVRLKRMVSDLAAQVEHAVQQAVEAAQQADETLARRVIEQDDAIDREEIMIEEECLKILALHQPVAGDLRYIVTFLKVNNELERIGDLAVNIAKQVLHQLDFGVFPEEKIDFAPQMEIARQMLKAALDALVARNCLEANETIRMDDRIDELNREVIERSEELIKQHPELAEYYISVIFISRHLERIGDCTTNICEAVIYLELGKIVRHGGLPE